MPEVIRPMVGGLGGTGTAGLGNNPRQHHHLHRNHLPTSVVNHHSHRNHPPPINKTEILSQSTMNGGAASHTFGGKALGFGGYGSNGRHSSNDGQNNITKASATSATASILGSILNSSSNSDHFMGGGSNGNSMAMGSNGVNEGNMTTTWAALASTTSPMSSIGVSASTSAAGGIPLNRPSRESVLQRLSEALLRRSLTKIDLSQRGLRPSDARLVKMALLQNSQLSVLKLGYNNLEDEGVSILAAGIAQHYALESLDLGFNNIGDEGCRALAEAIAPPAECFEDATALTTLNSNAQPSSMPPPRRHLKTLYLAGNLIGEDGAMAIADALRRGCSLKKLYLTGNRLGPDGVRAITEAILEDELRRKGGVEAYDSNCYDGNDFNNPNNNREALYSSSFAEEEKTMSTEDDSDSDSSDAAARIGMQELFVGGTGMGPAGCHSVSRLLARTCFLKVLSLPNCDIGDESVALLAASIKLNREKLPLESLQLSFNRITCKGIEFLANAIWGSRTLRELLLDNNEIADRGAQQIAAVLPFLKKLETLNVGFNAIKSLGMKLIMKAVPESSSLLSLSVSGNTVDASAAKAIAYSMAYNRSLVSLFLVHCNINTEGQRQITAGIVSNSRIALRELYGFSMGSIIVSLGFPAALEHWNNEQILNFIHLMWDKSAEDVAASREEEKSLDPLHFLAGGNSNESPGSNRRIEPLDATVVVEVARKAFNALVEDGVDVFSRRPGHPNEPSFASPIATDNIMVESPKKSGEESNSESFYETLATNQARSFVSPPDIPAKPALPDPCRKKRIVEWLCTHIQHLNKLAQLPFSSAELWRLHQHYFTPVVNESGGNVVHQSCNPSFDALGLTISSVPEVSRTSSTDNPVDSMNDSTEEAVMVPASDPYMKVSPAGITSLPMLKRKVSYRFLGDAMLASTPRMEARPTLHSPHSGGVSMMIEGGPTGHSMPPKTKRARRNRTRISFLPRVRAKLDSYLDVCHEKALITMRQLYYVEQAILSGQVNPIDPAKTARTHLCGDFALDAEIIVVDMI